jgi:hypothetical protein
MIKNYFLFLFLIAGFQIFAQEVYYQTGENFTKYNFRNSELQRNPNLQKGTGDFHEIGFTKPITDKNFLYSVALSLNEYNAIGGNSANSYRWDTQYLGVKGGLAYSFFPYNENGTNNLDFLLKAGLRASTIIYGKQEIDGTYFDIVNHKEFSGLLLESNIGLQLKYHVSSFGFLSAGYDFCQSINVTNRTEESLSLSTSQVQIGIHFITK